jgi:hypothetical protein
VAVAYFGGAGSELLPLRKGSILVVDMSPKAVRSGQTDPNEIIKLLEEGVEIHSVENLHAKVFVLGRRAIIGSANVSQHSATGLIEAAIEVADERVVAACRRFVLEKTGEYITLQHARSMVALYRPPKFGTGKRNLPKHSPLWAVSLEEATWDSEDQVADKEGSPQAEGNLSSSEFYRVDRFLWNRDQLIEKLKNGDQLLQIYKENRTKFVYPAGRVIHVQPYEVGDQVRAIIYLEVQKRLKRKRLSVITRHLGSQARILKRIAYARLLKNQSLIHALLNLWPRRLSPGLKAQAK